MDYNRDPCPWRIFDDCGGAYSIGFIGSGIFNLAGGARNAPKGITLVFGHYIIYTKII